MGIFAGSDTRRNRVISIRGPPGLQGIRGLMEDTGPQSPKCDKELFPQQHNFSVHAKM